MVIKTRTERSRSPVLWGWFRLPSTNLKTSETLDQDLRIWKFLRAQSARKNFQNTR